MLGALMDIADSMQEQKGNVSRDGNLKKEPKRNTTNKHCNTKINAFDGIINTKHR